MPAKSSKKQKKQSAKERNELRDFTNQELNNLSLDEVSDLFAEAMLKNLKKGIENS